MLELEGQMKVKDMCFQPFLENIKDSAAWIELGRSFHQEGTVNVKVHESFIIGRIQNVLIQAFQSNVIYAIFQTFNPLGKINPWQQFKSSPILWKSRAAEVRFYWSQVENKERWLKRPCLSICSSTDPEFIDKYLIF